MNLFGGHTGSAPSPFDAVDGHRLAGPASSHPLHGIAIEELVRPTSGAAGATFAVDRPARVGEGITGHLRVVAHEAIHARTAYLRLVGLRLVENRRSQEHRDAQGHVTHTETWVEVSGSLFAEQAFPEPAIPADLAPGASFEADFAVPGPPLGPPTAHLGEAIVAWALEVRWDVALGRDAFVAVGLPVAQHPDLLRAGVGKQGGASLLDEVAVGAATIAVTTPLPAPVGSEVAVSARWPDAPGGREARIELHRRNNAPNGTEGIVSSVAVPSDALRVGRAEARLAIPAGSPPSFDGAGLEVAYVIRVLVDRRLMPDAAIERPLGVA
jgi:hypothetical protein